jgi:DNA-binding MarR family transcriptional regulator
MTVPSLFDHARTTDPDTCRDAVPADVGPECARVLQVIRDYGGATRGQVASHLGADPSCVSRRITDLRQAGLVADSGERARGLAGRRQIVWVPAVATERVT